MKTLIIGKGEVGQALSNILQQYYEVWNINAQNGSPAGVGMNGYIAKRPDFEILHIAFPYSKEFVSEVKRYQELYNPTYTIIHSTVPVGVSRQCGAVHSPIIGIHPNLESGIKTFPKYLGGEQASEIADYFRRAGLKVYLFDKSETTELMKILDTTFYGVCIEYTKDVKRQCEKYGVPFEAWNIWTRNYNEGYIKLNHPEFTRPNLVPIMTKIKGHCVLPNTD